LTVSTRPLLKSPYSVDNVEQTGVGRKVQIQGRTLSTIWLTFYGLVVAVCSHTVHATSAMELELPLTVNLAYVGDINAAIETNTDEEDAEADVKIDPARLKVLLQPFANEEQLANWKLLADELDSWVRLNDLKKLGFDIWFDAGALTINSKVPRLGTQRVFVRGRAQPSPDKHYSQSRFASGLTMYARNSYHHTDLRAGSRRQISGLGDLQVDVDGFTTFGGFGGWSLFYQGKYKQGDKKPLQRDDVLLVHDDYERGLRYALGDIRPTTSRFQSSADMLGLSVERNYSDINPFRNLKPSGRSTFTLERESRVQFEVNGAIVDAQDLLPGTYSINDFPLAIGANDVRVWVDDGTSRREVASFSTYVDTTLLAEGITNFGTSIGVLRERGRRGSRRYSDDVGLMSFYEKGITDNVTIGAQAELSQGHGLLASSAIYGSRIGIIAAEAAVSRREGHDTGVASVLRYYYSGATRSDWQIQTDIQASYRSDEFMSLADFVTRPEERALNMRTSFAKHGIALSLAGELRTIDDIESKRFSAALSKSFDGFSVSLGYQRLETDRNGGDSDNQFNLTISKRFNKSSLRGQYKSSNSEYRAEWRKNGSRNVGDVRSRMLVTSDIDSNDAELKLGYIGNRYELDVRHNTSRGRLDDRADLSRTHLTVAGSLGYADGKFAFGRPFTDGFIIVERHKNLRGKKVFIAHNAGEDAVVTASKVLSTMLVPLNTNYRSQRYLFAVDDLPIGYDLGSADLSVYPGNLAGYYYRLGSDAANTVLGKIFSPDNQPLSLVSGKIVAIDSDKDTVETTIFTNRTGRFVAEKMKLGRYRIVFGDKDEWVAEIVVAEGDEPGLVMVGDIILEERK